MRSRKQHSCQHQRKNQAVGHFNFVKSLELVKPNLTINEKDYTLEAVYTSMCRDLVYNHVSDLLQKSKIKKATVLKRKYQPQVNDPNDITHQLVNGFVFLRVDHGISETPIYAIPAKYPQENQPVKSYVVGYPVCESDRLLQWESMTENTSSLISFSNKLTFQSDSRTIVCGGSTMEDDKISFRPKPVYSHVEDSQESEEFVIDPRETERNERKLDAPFSSHMITGSYYRSIGMTGSAVSLGNVHSYDHRWTFHSIHLGFITSEENVFTRNLQEKPFNKTSIAIRVDSLPFMMEYAHLINENYDGKHSNELRSYFYWNQKLLKDQFPTLYSKLFQF